jgi:hypothetical protein
MPRKSGSQIGVPNWDPKLGSQIGVPNRGSKSGFQIGVPNRGSKSGSQIRIPNRGPKSGSQIGVPNRGPKLGSQIGVPNRGPTTGSHIGVQNQGPKLAKNWVFLILLNTLQNLSFLYISHLCIEKTGFVPKAIPLPASCDAGKNKRSHNNTLCTTLLFFILSVDMNYGNVTSNLATKSTKNFFKQNCCDFEKNHSFDE